MWDYFDLRDRSSNPSRVDVHEHRAPTDESSKLLNEMREKTLKNLIAQFKVENNVLSGVVTYFAEDFCNGDYNVVLKFKLNNVDYTVSERIDKFDIHTSYIDDVMGRFAKHVVMKVTEQLLKTALQEPDGIRELYRNNPHEKL